MRKTICPQFWVMLGSFFRCSAGASCPPNLKSTRQFIYSRLGTVVRTHIRETNSKRFDFFKFFYWQNVLRLIDEVIFTRKFFAAFSRRYQRGVRI